MAGVADNNSNLGPFYHASYPTVTSVEDLLLALIAQVEALDARVVVLEEAP